MTMSHWARRRSLPSTSPVALGKQRHGGKRQRERRRHAKQGCGEECAGKRRQRCKLQQPDADQQRAQRQKRARAMPIHEPATARRQQGADGDHQRDAEEHCLAGDAEFAPDLVTQHRGQVERRPPADDLTDRQDADHGEAEPARTRLLRRRPGF
jgi:hypothetical protein